MKFFLVLVLIPVIHAFGESEFLQNDLFYDEYRPGGSHSIMYHDLSKLDFEILEVQKLFIPKWIDELVIFQIFYK